MFSKQLAQLNSGKKKKLFNVDINIQDDLTDKTINVQIKPCFILFF